MITRIVLLNACLILVLGLVSVELCNPALPVIKKALAISDGQAQQLIVWYLAGFAVSQLLYGSLSDKYGRVPVILFSLFFAAAGNYLTSTAGTGQQLAWFRLLAGGGQGCGGCCSIPGLLSTALLLPCCFPSRPGT